MSPTARGPTPSTATTAEAATPPRALSAPRSGGGFAAMLKATIAPPGPPNRAPLARPSAGAPQPAEAADAPTSRQPAIGTAATISTSGTTDTQVATAAKAATPPRQQDTRPVGDVVAAMAMPRVGGAARTPAAARPRGTTRPIVAPAANAAPAAPTPDPQPGVTPPPDVVVSPPAAAPDVAAALCALPVANTAFPAKAAPPPDMPDHPVAAAAPPTAPPPTGTPTGTPIAEPAASAWALSAPDTVPLAPSACPPAGATMIQAATPSLVSPGPPPAVAGTPAAPADQLGAAVAVLARQGQGSGYQGSGHLVVQMNPAELGQVQVSVNQPRGGAASVALLVARPETLLLLLRDQPQLHQALANAGIAADPSHVTLQLAPRAPDGAMPTPVQPAAENAAWNSDFTAFGNNERQFGHGWTQADDAPAEPDSPAAPQAAATLARLRGGIDITA
jgi:hypothetical protein